MLLMCDCTGQSHATRRGTGVH